MTLGLASYACLLIWERDLLFCIESAQEDNDFCWVYSCPLLQVALCHLFLRSQEHVQSILNSSSLGMRILCVYNPTLPGSSHCLGPQMMLLITIYFRFF